MKDNRRVLHFHEVQLVAARADPRKTLMMAMCIPSQLSKEKVQKRTSRKYVGPDGSFVILVER